MRGIVDHQLNYRKKQPTHPNNSGTKDMIKIKENSMLKARVKLNSAIHVKRAHLQKTNCQRVHVKLVNVIPLSLAHLTIM